MPVKPVVVNNSPLVALVELQKAGLYLDPSAISKVLSVAGEVPS